MADVELNEVLLPKTTSSVPFVGLALGIELDEQITWPSYITCRKNIIDLETQKQAIEMVKKMEGSLLIGVAAYRSPDRRIQHIVRDLIAATPCKPWLVLLNRNPAVEVANSRKLGWFRLAEACQIPAEQVVIR